MAPFHRILPPLAAFAAVGFMLATAETARAEPEADGKTGPNPGAAAEGKSEAPPEPSPEKGKVTFTKVCAACHGPKGDGKKDLKTPSIASMPAWYITRQLGKFQKDIRGVDTKDVTGTQMRAIAHTLTPEEVADVAAYIASLPVSPSRHTLSGDTDKGKELFTEICMECHRYNASGEFVFGSPPLTGLQDWYILAQLKKFKPGIRGGHIEDEHGAKMHTIAGYLREEDMIDIASFIPTLAEKYLNREKERR